MNKISIFVYLLLLSLIAIACSSEENTVSKGDGVIETVDYYGIQIPYEPLEEKDMPTWLIDAKTTWAPIQICWGIYNNEPVYHLNSRFDSSIIGHLYDENGKSVDIALLTNDDLQLFLSNYRNVKCIYYKNNTN